MIKRAVIGLTMVSVFAAPAALAGWQADAPVYINTSSRYFYGSLGSTRNTADPNQYIGCDVEKYSSGYVWAYCYAKNNANPAVSVLCTTSSAAVVDAALHLQGDSFVWIYYDANNNCTEIDVLANSGYAPKQ